MLAVGRVLLVLLAGIPVCRAADDDPGTGYSSYYEADGDSENADFYDSYNEELKHPPERSTAMEAHTRLKRNDLEDIRTLNSGETIDVKGMLNNIMPGRIRDTSKEQPARDNADSYDYPENSNKLAPEDRTAIPSEFKRWLPTVKGQRSPATGTQENEVDSSSEGTEQHWSFMNQPETTYSKDDIVAEVRRRMPEGVVPMRSSIDLPHWTPQQEVQTIGTAENTEETENTNDIRYPQETTTYSNSFIQTDSKKLVEAWSPETKVIETSTYSNSEMQAEVNKLVQHWSSNSKQESTYNDAAMRADVRLLGQHWSRSSAVKSPSHNRIVQHRNPATSKATDSEIHHQKSGIFSRLGTLGPEKPMSDLNHRIPSEDAQQWNPSDIVQQRDPFRNLQHQLPSDKDLVMTPAVKEEEKPAVKVLHWSRTGNAEQWKSLGAEDEDTTLDADDITGVMRQLPGGFDNPGGGGFNPGGGGHYPGGGSYNPEGGGYNPEGGDNPGGGNFAFTVTKPVIKVTIVKGGPSATVPVDVAFSAATATAPGGAPLGSAVGSAIGVTEPVITVTAGPGGPSATAPLNAALGAATATVPGGAPLGGAIGVTVPGAGGLGAMTSLPGQGGFPITPGGFGKGDSGQGGSGQGGSGQGGSGHARPGASGGKTKPTSKTKTTKKKSKRTTTRQTTKKTKTKKSTTTTTTTTTPPIDIDAIMAIISNLTYDYEWNLTEQFNKSIIQHGVPTCPWKGGGQWGPGGAWTAIDNGSTLYPWDFENSSVVSKCFVCGLSTPEIPRNAYCADAFAGDFLPLMPIDARSRSMIANYRKYCRYIDVQNYVENPEEPRAIYGRFTGGCAVRWTDITGVYTQRTCRSRYRPLLGKHFASKRMAKLELALVNVDNGCIISPMATLLPVSRGISLYARFHACVCNTNWCNRATLKQTSSDTVLTILVAHWLSHSS